MNGRKPAQITTHKGAFSDTALAVCDDGTMWSSLLGAVPLEWTQLPPIPQDEQPAAALRPGPVTAAEASRAMEKNSALQDIGHTTCSAMESVLDDFLDRRSIPTEAVNAKEPQTGPVTEEEFDRATQVFIRHDGGAVESLHAALADFVERRAAGARP